MLGKVKKIAFRSEREFRSQNIIIGQGPPDTTVPNKANRIEPLFHARSLHAPTRLTTRSALMRSTIVDECSFCFFLQKEWRESYSEFKRKVAQCVRKSQEDCS